jgi:hypothetical protein
MTSVILPQWHLLLFSILPNCSVKYFVFRLPCRRWLLPLLLWYSTSTSTSSTCSMVVVLVLLATLATGTRYYRRSKIFIIDWDRSNFIDDNYGKHIIWFILYIIYILSNFTYTNSLSLLYIIIHYVLLYIIIYYHILSYIIIYIHILYYNLVWFLNFNWFDFWCLFG